MVSRIVPPKEVEDIVQETYVRLCQIKTPESIAKPKSFLYRTAKNLALDHIKRAETRLVDEMPDDASAIEPGEDIDTTFQAVASQKEFSQFCEAVRDLPVQCQKVFVLKKVYGYSQKEIAKKMQLSESTVEKHIALGIKKCTQFMRSIQSEPERQTSLKHTDLKSETKPQASSALQSQLKRSRDHG